MVLFRLTPASEMKEKEKKKKKKKETHRFTGILLLQLFMLCFKDREKCQMTLEMNYCSDT